VVEGAAVGNRKEHSQEELSPSLLGEEVEAQFAALGESFAQSPESGSP
jgi:hypothetical protein